MIGYYTASEEMTNQIVRHLREYFLDNDEIRKTTNIDFSILGERFTDGSNKQPYYLISARFPDRFRFYPHILVNCSVQRPIKVDANNLLAQRNAISKYGRRDVDYFVRGGAINLGLSLTVRAMDERTTEQISDLLIYYSLYYGWEHFKKTHWFIEPFSGSPISADNYRDSSDSIRVYRANLSSSMRGHWTRAVVPNVPVIGGFKVTLGQTHLSGYDSDISYHIIDELVLSDKIDFTHPPIILMDGVVFGDSIYDHLGDYQSVSTIEGIPGFLTNVGVAVSYAETLVSNIGFEDSHLDSWQPSDRITNSINVSDYTQNLYETSESRLDAFNHTDTNSNILIGVNTLSDSIGTSTGVVDQQVGYLNDISGIQFWFEADNPANILSGSSISQLTDKSTNAFHSSQANGSNQPTLVTNSINGLPSIALNGTSSYTTFSGSALNMFRNIPGVTICALLKPSTTSGTGYLLTAFTNTTSSRVALIRSANKIQAAGRQNNADTAQLFTSANAINTSTWYMVYIILDYANDTLKIRENNNTEQSSNVTWGAGTVSSNTASYAIMLGSSNLTPSLCFGGNVAGIAAWNRVLSPSELTTMRSYWSNRYNLGLS